MIRIAVCDDEINLIEEQIKKLISSAMKKSELIAEVTYYNNGLLLLNEFEKHNVSDIVILDIDMPEINGKELARKLRAVDADFTLAFFTAYDDEVFSSIPIGISAFIPKRYDEESTISALTELFGGFLQKKPQWNLLGVQIDGKPSTIKLRTGNIYYFEFYNRNITLRTYNECHTLIERTFENIVKEYQPKGFFKINRACIVNVAKIFELIDDYIIMDNGDKLFVSRRKRKELLQKMTLLPDFKEKTL
ncbi:MAG: LytTR family DNA-binding domain-containing protein [Lachnospiraceae bacterium]|nr:LytTR family DNA-binding domain-containing protein [Ruminococcus sp.]MCM1277167.1 LytTR family DNA-binding domain-containing protein [Lachnospiraceae bacterium]